MVWRLFALLLVVAALGAACGDDDEETGGGQATDGGGRVSGTITVDGSSTVAPLTEAVAEEFRREEPGVNVSVGTSGTGGGFKKFCNGEIDIADASRAIKDEEKAACQGKNIAYTEFRVGLDGLVVVTSAQNTFVECLNKDQLATIFKQGGATSWNQVDPKFPAEKISIFAPGTDSGTYDFFVEEVLGNPDEPESPKPRTDYTASEDDNVLVQGIEGEKNSWGYFGFAYFNENEAKLKAIRLAEKTGGSCVTPSDETVVSGDYFLSRPLFIYVKNDALNRPETKEFVRFYLETTPDLIKEVGYTVAPKEDYDKGLATLGGTTGG